MEKATKIKVKDLGGEANKGVYIQMDCCMCPESHPYGEETEEKLIQRLDIEGWKNLVSDEYGCIGWWCGCDYMP